MYQFRLVERGCMLISNALHVTLMFCYEISLFKFLSKILTNFMKIGTALHTVPSPESWVMLWRVCCTGTTIAPKNCESFSDPWKDTGIYMEAEYKYWTPTAVYDCVFAILLQGRIRLPEVLQPSLHPVFSIFGQCTAISHIRFYRIGVLLPVDPFMSIESF